MRLEGVVLTPQGFRSGALEIGPDGRIIQVVGAPVEEAAARKGALPIILPGFIDLHVHGGGGHDVMDGGGAAARVAQFHAGHGTTAIAATTMTAPWEDLEAAFRGLAPHVQVRPSNGARILGVHLEGPYINRERLGAQPDHARPIDLAELRRLHALAPIRLVTLAPEIPANLRAFRELLAEGIRVQIGHTEGSYEEAVEALHHGASSFTHLFNAMPGLHHRNPGVVGAALAWAEYAEIIPDLLHVHPGAILAAKRAIPRLYCVTDSTSAAGMPDGEYRLGRHKVVKCLGGVRLPDGTLAGSALTMDQALRNLVDGLGLSLAEAARCLSTNAADHLGLSDRGRLVPGAMADAVVLDGDLSLQGVLLEGVWRDPDAR
ncbi:N-acetylglucosamine-6-phosphate deacetylase [Geothrix oryzisoli]|uniref:N-acetylglucosamine-6-phosphate deacetylase n=1 Tax=Geothrix oryzisoli TaxID=2922721 RepID=UPI001FACF0A6|nr:N-acetylglucosamine-6-phosphate deacetylase [Geothrix oryzisoli]